MIRELRSTGWAISAISDETGYDPKTIRKYLKVENAPVKVKRRIRKGKLEPYKDYIIELIREGTTHCEVLFDEIQKLGYKGKMIILTAYVRPYRLQPKKNEKDIADASDCCANIRIFQSHFASSKDSEKQYVCEIVKSCSF